MVMLLGLTSAAAGYLLARLGYAAARDNKTAASPTITKRPQIHSYGIGLTAFYAALFPDGFPARVVRLMFRRMLVGTFAYVCAPRNARIELARR